MDTAENSIPAPDGTSDQALTEEARCVIEYSIAALLRSSPERQQKFLADIRADSGLAAMADVYERIIQRHQVNGEVAA